MKPSTVQWEQLWYEVRTAKRAIGPFSKIQPALETLRKWGGELVRVRVELVCTADIEQPR